MPLTGPGSAGRRPRTAGASTGRRAAAGRRGPSSWRRPAARRRACCGPSTGLVASRQTAPSMPLTVPMLARSSSPGRCRSVVAGRVTADAGAQWYLPERRVELQRVLPDERRLRRDRLQLLLGHERDRGGRFVVSLLGSAADAPLPMRLPLASTICRVYWTVWRSARWGRSADRMRRAAVRDESASRRASGRCRRRPRHACTSRRRARLREGGVLVVLLQRDRGRVGDLHLVVDDPRRRSHISIDRGRHLRRGRRGPRSRRTPGPGPGSS